jgi:iron complex outermembrane receptor protein
LKNYLIFPLFFIINLCLSIEGLAQTDSSFLGKTYEFTVGDILNQVDKTTIDQNKISSVSSRNETNFEVPIGASVVSKEMIRNSGCITLVEALRLLPGVLVRETSAGNFDVRIRGFTSSAPAQDLVTNTENMLLVMIDNRPVYNYFSGGTFWETLPIDVNDIERIELVRGAAAAMYGPNAVTGVIHFITQKATRNGLFNRSNLFIGNQNNLFFNTSLGYQFNEKIGMGFSGNFGHLNRSQNASFYSFTEKAYVEEELSEILSYQTLVPLGEIREIYSFPNIEESYKRFAFNGFVNLTPVKNWQMDLKFGTQESSALNPISENTYTPLSNTFSKTQYIDFNSTIHRGNIQISYLSGDQEPGRGFLAGAFNFGLTDINANYDFKFGNLFIKPTINFRRAIYDDSKAGDDQDFVEDYKILQGKVELDNVGLSIRADYQLKNLRLIAAVRQDKLNVQESPIYGYQFALTYQIKQKHLVRLNYGKANRSAFVSDVFPDYLDRNLIPTANPNVFARLGIKGNPDVSLPAVNTLEIGYRLKLTDKWNLDFEYFHNKGRNYITRFISISPINQTTLRFDFNSQNDALEVVQQGITTAFEYNHTANQFRAFLNLQWTDLQKFSPFDLLVESNQTYDIKNYRVSPNWYGGVYWNHRFSAKWSINLNTYFFGRHEIWHRVDRTYLQAQFNQGNFVNKGTGAEIKTKLLLNFKIMFSPAKQITTFINIRNLLNQTNFEYYYTDKIGTNIFGGINFNF